MDEKYMNLALKGAMNAYKLDEVPIGAVIVHNDQVIAEAHNLRETDQNPIAHAEILAIKKASEVLGTWKLNECTLYVTLEPCIMCAGTIIQSRIGKVVFGSYDAKGGAMGSPLNILEYKGFNHYPEVVGGILEDESKKLIQQYFKEKRETKMKIQKIDNEAQFEMAKMIRTKVFVEEQAVDPDIEYDEYDDITRTDVIQIIATVKGNPVATLRLIAKDKTLKVGRVAVLKEYRKQGIGLRMMHYAEKYACNNGFKQLELGAQLTAIPFYEASGYEAYGDIFLDANIEHKMMKKRCKS